MGELGEIGWYIKLDIIQEKNMTTKTKEKDFVKQPLF